MGARSKSRQKARIEKRAEERRAATSKRKRIKYRKRRFPILLRVLVIAIVLAASLILGSMVGYGVIGDGNSKDVLKKETWQHIIDIVKKE